MGITKNQFNRHVPEKLKALFSKYCETAGISLDEATAEAIKDYLNKNTIPDPAPTNIDSITAFEELNHVSDDLQKVAVHLTNSTTSILALLHAEKETSSRDIEVLRAKEEEYKNRIDQCSQELDTMHREYNVLLGENNNLTDRVHLLEHELEGLNRQTQDLDDAKAEITRLNSDLAHERAEKDIAYKKLAELSEKYLGSLSTLQGLDKNK